MSFMLSVMEAAPCEMERATQLKNKKVNSINPKFLSMHSLVPRKKKTTKVTRKVF